jgi:lysophospholipase L1-like esterase
MHLIRVNGGRNAAGTVRRRRLLLLAASLALAACGRRKTTRGTPLPAGAAVLALGDSITHGTGAAPDAAYPAQLARLTGWNVINAGVPGDTTAQMLERLPALLVEHTPALVIVSAGGNDFLRHLPEADTEAHLRRIVALARGARAQVLLVAVPRPTLAAAVGAGLADHPLYDRLATELTLPLHAGGWARVLADEQLKSDQIHANAAGYQAFAVGLRATLRDAGMLP